ncbi:gasdermin-C-like [Equus caballus]|uniref:gasdermin-C-like n=1 Tax=Equus caballus TaxID=9796 RepID=UPI0004BDE9E5|nr:PREDICTED: gasdermin-C [Equus przewalskii]
MEAAECHGFSLEFWSVAIPPCNWTDLQKRKVLDPEPSFLKQCRKTSVNPHVVTEAVEMLNSPVLHETSSVNMLWKCCTLEYWCQESYEDVIH